VDPLVLLQKVLGGEGLAAHIALPQLRGGRARLRRTGGLLEHAQRPTQRVWLGCGARGVSKGYEENYFFVMRQDGIYYNELETRVRLNKRRVKVGQQPNNTKLVSIFMRIHL